MIAEGDDVPMCMTAKNILVATIAPHAVLPLKTAVKVGRINPL
jgi:hypothetical protein